MPFRPHTLAFKLRRLIDAGICSVQDISRSSGVGLRAIDQIMRGAKPGPQTAHQLGKVLSYYLRQEHGHLKLEDGSAEPEPAPQEGLFEELDAFAGIIEVKALDGRGVRMGMLQFRSDTVDDELLSDLERWHGRKNPTHLTLAETSDQSS